MIKRIKALLTQNIDISWGLSVVAATFGISFIMYMHLLFGGL